MVMEIFKNWRSVLQNERKRICSKRSLIIFRKEQFLKEQFLNFQENTKNRARKMKRKKKKKESSTSPTVFYNFGACLSSERANRVWFFGSYAACLKRLRAAAEESVVAPQQLLRFSAMNAECVVKALGTILLSLFQRYKR